MSIKLTEHTEDPCRIGQEKAKFLCPHCHILSLHLLHDASRKLPHSQIDSINLQAEKCAITREHLIYTCVGCGKDTYFFFEVEMVQPKPSHQFQIPRMNEKILHQYPLVIPSLHHSVPHPVKQAMIEAEKCLAVGAPNGCGTMARRAIHSLCQDKKATGDNLYKQLESLRVSGTITDDIWEWASDLRIIGRDGAHPEWPEVSLEDADYAVRFLHEIIRYVYINPWERTQRRGTKKAAADSQSENPA